MPFCLFQCKEVVDTYVPQIMSLLAQSVVSISVSSNSHHILIVDVEAAMSVLLIIIRINFLLRFYKINMLFLQFSYNNSHERNMLFLLSSFFKVLGPHHRSLKC